MQAKLQLEPTGRPWPALATLLTVTLGGGYIAAMRSGPLLQVATAKGRRGQR